MNAFHRVARKGFTDEKYYIVILIDDMHSYTQYISIVEHLVRLFVELKFKLQTLIDPLYNSFDGLGHTKLITRKSYCLQAVNFFPT